MPPFPTPDNAAFRVAVQAAVEAYRSGEATAEQAILNAAANAWYEGHIQGEDVCTGCDYRGNLPKQSSRGLVDPNTN